MTRGTDTDLVTVALDAMGGDGGSTPLVEGAIQAARSLPVKILLVGREHSLQRLLKHFRYQGDNIEIVPCSQVVRMDDSPADSLQKKDSSIAVGAQLVKGGRAQALVSAGNTGASMAHCMRSWRRLKGVARPGIAALVPTAGAVPCLILDVGANVDCKPRHLVDFALMGEVYYREVLGQHKPTVGLLSVGEERKKGNALTLATLDLLEQTHMNVIGNVESTHVFDGRVHVLVCDGFVGNVLLKTAEAVARMIMSGVKGAMKSNVMSLAGALMLSPSMMRFKRKIDHSEYGGAPLLGLNGVCIIGHGASEAKAVRNAIRVARESVLHDVNRHIVDELARLKEILNGELEENTVGSEL